MILSICDLLSIVLIKSALGLSSIVLKVEFAHFEVKVVLHILLIGVTPLLNFASLLGKSLTILIISGLKE